MKIEVFEQLLKVKKGNSAAAYVPDSMSGSRQARVAVVFSPGGKVYYYRGTIHAVAQTMKLIPSMDIMSDSKRAALELIGGGSTIAYLASSDTIAYLLQERGIVTFDLDTWTRHLTSEPAGKDEYDYRLHQYTLEVK